MLPTRSYQDQPSLPRSTSATEQRPILLVVASSSDVEQFPKTSVTRLAVHTTPDALLAIERSRPRVVAIDWDYPNVAARQIVEAARRLPGTGVLVAMDAPAQAPAAIKCGCHAVLLKPFPANLAAGRIGRLCREVPVSAAGRRQPDGPSTSGSHRVWPDQRCPTCQASGVTSFEFSSYRRMWYACLMCDAVWLERRRE